MTEFKPMEVMNNDNQELLSCEESRPIVATESQGWVRRALPIIALTVGLVAGGVGHRLTKQGRLTPPTRPLASLQEFKYAANLSALEGKYFTHSLNPTNQVVPSSGVCGAARCTAGDLCCSGSKGNLCGGAGSNCFEGNGENGAIVCGQGSQGCQNDQGAAYCCAPGNSCFTNVCVSGYCFPGEASVTVKDVGAVPIQSLRSGDYVLAKNGDYEPVLGFLHVTAADEVSNFLSVKHSNGQLRVSPHHVVFVENGDKLATDLVAGDKLLVTEEPGVVAREVLYVTQETGRSGMFAPMTPSGTVVVDNVLASNYASYGHVSFPHCALHGVFFPVRAFHALGLASLLGSSPPAATEMHPYAAFVWGFVGPIATKVF